VSDEELTLVLQYIIFCQMLACNLWSVCLGKYCSSVSWWRFYAPPCA